MHYILKYLTYTIEAKAYTVLFQYLSTPIDIFKRQHGQVKPFAIPLNNSSFIRLLIDIDANHKHLFFQVYYCRQLLCCLQPYVTSAGTGFHLMFPIQSIWQRSELLHSVVLYNKPLITDSLDASHQDTHRRLWLEKVCILLLIEYLIFCSDEIDFFVYPT